MIFVFGSNEAGIHGAGAARTAYRIHGAFYGLGFGPSGNSFAIPTKDWRIQSLTVEQIRFYINRFIQYANQNHNRQFQITAIGCDLAGFLHEEIAPLFAGAPENCFFDEVWKPYLPDNKKFWGTF